MAVPKLGTGSLKPTNLGNQQVNQLAGSVSDTGLESLNAFGNEMQNQLAGGGASASLPTFNIDSEKEKITPDTSIMSQAFSDIKAGMPIDKFDEFYPELSANKQAFIDLSNDLAAGMPEEKISELYPEFSGLLPDVTIKEQPIGKEVDPLSFKGFYEYGLKPSVKTLGETFTKSIPDVGKDIYGGLKAGLGDITEGFTGERPGFAPDKGIGGRIFETLQTNLPEMGDAFVESLGKSSPIEGAYQFGGIGVWTVFSILGDAFFSGLKTLTPEETEVAVKNEITKHLQTENGQKLIEGMEYIQQAETFLKESDPDAYRNFKASKGWAEGLGEFVGASAFKKIITESLEAGTKQTIKEGITGASQESKNTLINKAKDLITSTKDQTGKIEKRIEEGDQEFIGKVGEEPIVQPLEKEISQKAATKVQQTTDELKAKAGEIIQGDLKDKDAAVETFKLVDTKETDSYGELGNRIGVKQKEIVDAQDEIFRGIDTKYGEGDTVKTVESPLGDKQMNYVKDAVDDIEATWGKEGDIDSVNDTLFGKDKTIGEVMRDYRNGNASIEDINDIARYYNGKFRDKIYTKKGDAKNSEKASSYENTRTGVKTFVRDQLPDTQSQELDIAYSNLANTKRLVDDMAEKVNTLEQKFTKIGMGEKLFNWGYEIADTVTGGAVGAFRKKFLTPNNIGEKIRNSSALEKNLPDALKRIDELLGNPDEGKIIKFLEKLNIIKKTEDFVGKPKTSTKKVETTKITDKVPVTKPETKGPVTPTSKKQKSKESNIAAKEQIEESNDINELNDIKDIIKSMNANEMFGKRALLDMINKKTKTIESEAKGKLELEVEAKKAEKEGVKMEFGEDLIKSFKAAKIRLNNLQTTKGADKFDSIEKAAATDEGIRKVVDDIKDYLNQRGDTETSVQEVWDRLSDSVKTPAPRVSKIKTPKKTVEEKKIDLEKKAESKKEAEKIIGSTQKVNWGKGDMQLKTYTKGEAKLEILEKSPYAEGRNSVYETFVPESQRRQGVASDMIKQSQKDYDNLSAQIGNETSVKVYYKNGFRPFDKPNATLNESISIFKKDGNINMNWEKSTPKKIKIPSKVDTEKKVGDNIVVAKDGTLELAPKKEKVETKTKSQKISEGYNKSAKERFNKGDLTKIEQQKIRDKLESNYIGKKVKVGGSEGEIVSKSAFGKIKVKVGDKTLTLNSKDLQLEQPKVTQEDVLKYAKGGEYEGYKIVPKKKN